jgi:CubicO group peptidase (beta-lactamase class C family)
MNRFIKYLMVTAVLALSWMGLVFISTLNGWWYQPFTATTEVNSFTKAVQHKIDNEFTGNFAMALIKNGKVEKEHFHSINKPVDRNTIFQISSMSKFVSAAGVLKLVEMGKLDLDTPVNQYLKRWQLPPSSFDNNEVTVRMLLSHTAGLTDGLGYSGFMEKDSVQSLEASLKKAKDADDGLSGEVKVGVQPGSTWKYSGGGFTLLQLLVEETSGQTFDAFMKDNLFKPLGMTSSCYVLPDSLENRLCEFYNEDKTVAPHFYYTSLAATSLYTSLADLEKFYQFFLKGPGVEPIGRGVLSPETIKNMRDSHWDIMGERIYGLGCMLYIGLENNEDIFGHDGKSTPPINTAIRINPISGDGIIVLETGNSNLATRIASDWVFLETKKTDTLLFTMLLPKMIQYIIIGIILITAVSIFIARRRKKYKK